jgi:hypothetical protein
MRSFLKIQEQVLRRREDRTGRPEVQGRVRGKKMDSAQKTRLRAL